MEGIDRNREEKMWDKSEKRREATEDGKDGRRRRKGRGGELRGKVRQGRQGKDRTGSTSGLDTGRRILNHEALCWRDAQLFCGSQKNVGSRLQALKQIRRHYGVEVCSSVETCCSQVCVHLHVRRGETVPSFCEHIRD